MIYAENILLCIAVPFLISLLFLRGEVRRFISAFLLGMAMCLIAAYINGFLGIVAKLNKNDTSVFISPMVEEFVKLLPLLFFFIMFGWEDRSLIVQAVAIGAGFATFENCCYILTFGAESLTYVLIRGLAVGVMHIVSITALALWLIFVKRLKALSFSAVIGGLSLAMVFHALYNLLVSEEGATRLIGYLLPMLTAVCLYPVLRKLYEPKDEQC